MGVVCSGQAAAESRGGGKGAGFGREEALGLKLGGRGGGLGT